MCLHMFTYYPRMNNLYGCMTSNSEAAWIKKMNMTELVHIFVLYFVKLRIFIFRLPLNYTALYILVTGLKWTPESIEEWQTFYNNASRSLMFDRAGNFTESILPKLPEFKDLKPPECQRSSILDSAACQHLVSSFMFRSFFITAIRMFL
jgi:hypothetical protein